MNDIERIKRLYETHGTKPCGNGINQIEHALQVARMAELGGADEPLIAAALLHDIGHLLYNDDVLAWNINDRHEVIGAGILKPIFGVEVSEPVKLHVLAKRYLCAIDPMYYEGLSDASRKSLDLQGGQTLEPMKKTFFERNQFFSQAIELRLWDDQCSDSSAIDVDFDTYLPLLKSLHTGAARHYASGSVCAAAR